LIVIVVMNNYFYIFFIFQSMSNLKVLDLSDNPLECNEDFRELVKWLTKNKVRLWPWVQYLGRIMVV
jgi:hypothetical protein